MEKVAEERTGVEGMETGGDGSGVARGEACAEISGVET